MSQADWSLWCRPAGVVAVMATSFAVALLGGCPPPVPPDGPSEPPPPKAHVDWQPVFAPAQGYVGLYRAPTPEGWILLVKNSSGSATAAVVVSDTEHAWCTPAAPTLVEVEKR